MRQKDGNMKAYIACLTGIIIMAAATTHAAEPHEAKPVACLYYSIANLTDGSSVGICEATKAGGKPRVLRDFSETTVLNKSTGKTVKMLVGFP